MKDLPHNDEIYCLETLGIKNARGEVAKRLREVSPALTNDELLSLPLSKGRFLVVDLETTGMKPGKSRIIEIGAVEVDGLSLGRNLSSLVFPGKSVPPFISSLTGITNSMVVSAPRLEDVLPLFKRMLKGRVFVAHNSRFDRSFLEHAWQAVWGEELTAPDLCTVKLSRRVFPELESHNLDSLTSRLHIRPESPNHKARHRALGDAIMTASALIKIIRKVEQEGDAETVGDLLYLQKKRRKKKTAPTPPLF